MAKKRHDYEVWMETHIGMRICKFPASEYETDEDQEEALFDLIRGCRFSDTVYTVFKDDNIIDL